MGIFQLKLLIKTNFKRDFMSVKKPIIPNNSYFQDYLIRYRMIGDEKIECYLTDDHQYLYIINEAADIVSSTYLIKSTFYSQKKYYYFVISEYIEDLKKLWKDLTQLKGFALVAGMKNIKNELYKNVISPILNPQKYEKFKVSVPNGILLYGPTGCGKTFIVEKLAEELNYNFIKIDHSDLASPYIHESVIKISKLFDKAKKMAPCILFLDEIEALMPERSAVGENAQYKRDETNEFLLQLNNAGKDKILVIGATNNIELMDGAIIRSGRFDEKIYVPAPDEEARISLFKLALNGRPVEKEMDYSKLAKFTEGYSCSDIVHIVEDSARTAILNDKESLSMDEILSVIKKTHSSIPNIEKQKIKLGFLS